jgi:DNA-binding transcriptional LysR family regulator
MAVPALLAANPDMVAVVPDALVDNPAAGGLIRRVETEFAFASVPVFQFWHRRYQSDNFSLWLRSLMRKIFSSEKCRMISTPPALPAVPALGSAPIHAGGSSWA